MQKKLTKGISWQSEELLAAGQRRARELGISFSGYINSLVRKDLGFFGVLSQDAEKDISNISGQRESKPPKKDKSRSSTGG